MAAISFHAHHAPLGAYATFTCGEFGAGGGFAIESGQPPAQNMVVGYIDADDGVTRCLPFTTAALPDLDSFVEGASGQVAQRVIWDDENEVQREYAAGTDSWTVDRFNFTIYTPVESLPDPAEDEAGLLRALLPVVTARLSYDNRDGSSAKTLVFLNSGAGAPRVFDSGVGSGVGVQFGRDIGIAAPAGATAFQQWHETDWFAQGRDHLLGGSGGLALEVPAGEIGHLDVVIGFYRAGPVTTGVESSFYYTRGYASLADVLANGLERCGQLQDRALAMDAQLRESGLSVDRQWLVAHAQRSYWGNTQLVDAGGKARWIVLEGEYTMINTFDLAVDQCFYELPRPHGPTSRRRLPNLRRKRHRSSLNRTFEQRGAETQRQIIQTGKVILATEAGLIKDHQKNLVNLLPPLCLRASAVQQVAFYFNLSMPRASMRFLRVMRLMPRSSAERS